MRCSMDLKYLLVLALLMMAFSLSRSDEICCGNAGCFNNDPPFHLMPLPDCPASLNPLIHTMFTRTNRNDGQIASETEAPAIYDPNHRTVFIAHGWTQNGGAAWLHEMKDAFLDREDINVVIVNWGGGAQILNYNKAASNTRAAGAQTALVIQRLLQVAGSASSRMWCVGHSLGSHVCGHTGMSLPSNTPLGRATGMDPAGPLFETNEDRTVGINKSSATFVDILHTDSTGSGALGTLRDIGHIDFYPQGGTGMPGCLFKRSFKNRSFDSATDETIEKRDLCSHARAYQYMTESLRSDCFRSTWQCSDYTLIPESCWECTCGNFPCAYMGYAADSSCIREGLYYLEVTASPPYCAG